MELLRLAAVALLVGCYSPGFSPCQVRCGEGMPECPDGTSCNEGYCQAAGDETVCQGRAAAVAAGGRHTCAIGDDLKVYCWGDNRSGQLGRPGVDRSGMPALTTPQDAWGHIAAGESHSCAIDDSQRLWCWGSNGSGQIGNGDIGTPAPDPETVGTDNGEFGYTAVSVSWANTLAIQEGVLWSWGDNGYHQLGADVGNESGVPVPVDDTRVWTQVAAGREHACALAGQELYCWGEADGGRLGRGTQDDELTPALVAGSWRAIAAGYFHTCAISEVDRSLWCWGFNDTGQVGSTEPFELEPHLVDGERQWEELSAGGFHTCAITTDGELYCFGEGLSGELGDGERQRYDSPMPVGAPDGDTGWSSVSAGGEHTCAAALGGALWCWGANGDGQVGNGEMVDEREPVLTAAPRWLQVSAGPDFTCARATDIAPMVEVQCWGNGRVGQLGDGDPAYRVEPTPIDVGQMIWSEVHAGGEHACAIASTHALVCWGANDSGQLGTDDIDPRLLPTEPDDGSNCWADLATGSLHTCALVDPECDGEIANDIFCWGNDRDQQLGNGGDTTDALTPTLVTSAQANWTGVYAGGAHTCATKASSLWCWGDNQAGEAGVGTDDPNVPAPIMIDSGEWSEVAMSPAFPGHTCGIRGGAVLCWGENSDGQIGDSPDRRSPFLVPGLGTFQQISVCAGDFHSCAVDANATLRCWGGNARGQLGNNSVESATTPVTIPGAWSQVSCGGEHTCAVGSDEAVRCWGRNQEGQLGNGKVTPAVPTRVNDF